MLRSILRGVLGETLPGFGAGVVGGAAAPYITSGRDFDGTNDHASLANGPAGIVDGKQGLLSYWERVDVSNGGSIIGSTGFKFSAACRNTPSNAPNIFAANAAGAAVLDLRGLTVRGTGTWFHVLASWDLVAGVGHLYVSDTDDKNQVTLVDDTIDYTVASWAIGAEVPTGGRFSGCLSEIFFHTSYLDLSVTANRRKFISAGGKPVSLGADGSTPLGVQPLIYMPNGDPASNLGTGGNFTVTGSLDVASTSPSD